MVSRRRIFVYFVAILVVICILLYILQSQKPILTEKPVQVIEPNSTRMEFQRVNKVTDGDSIVLEDGSKIRLLGINAPEEGHPFFDGARIRLSSLVLGKGVQLESDFDDKDPYGRFLRYVFVDDIFVNVQLVKEGFANVFMESGLKYEERLCDAEYYAKIHRLGLWKMNLTYIDSIYVIDFHYDAYGNDDENLNDEYFILGNKGNAPINMTGWVIKDETNTIFNFPIFMLNSRENVTIHTGSGINIDNSLYWDNRTPIWGNKGDTLYLRNSDGELVLLYEY